jgi:hypothetical protein
MPERRHPISRYARGPANRGMQEPPVLRSAFEVIDRGRSGAALRRQEFPDSDRTAGRRSEPAVARRRAQFPRPGPVARRGRARNPDAGGRTDGNGGIPGTRASGASRQTRDDHGTAAGPDGIAGRAVSGERQGSVTSHEQDRDGRRVGASAAPGSRGRGAAWLREGPRLRMRIVGDPDEGSPAGPGGTEHGERTSHFSADRPCAGAALVVAIPRNLLDFHRVLGCGRRVVATVCGPGPGGPLACL